MSGKVTMFNPTFPFAAETSTDKVKKAVVDLQKAFSVIVDEANYYTESVADWNDPLVQFGIGLCTKYKNDLEFHTTMTFPASLNGYYDKDSDYLHQRATPYVFNSFPTNFPELPASAFSYDTVNDYLKFEQRCGIGEALFRYLIETAIYRNDNNYSSKMATLIISQILNEASLKMLCHAYNIEFNYKLYAFQEPHKLFLAYLGTYYECQLRGGSGPNELYQWCRQLLGYRDFAPSQHPLTSSSTPPLNTSPATVNTHSQHTMGTSGQAEENPAKQQPILTGEVEETEKAQHLDNLDGELQIQDYLQSVQQDLNTMVKGSTDVQYEVSEYPDLKTGFFKCTLKINGAKISESLAHSKKLAKSGAALEASTDVNTKQYIRRAYYDQWFRKYIDHAAAIRKKLTNDARFAGSDSIPEQKNEHGCVANDDGGLTLEGGEGTDKVQLPLLQARNKLYAYYHSKHGVTPKYEINQMGEQSFRADLFIGDKLRATATGVSKKEASAKAAMQIIEAESIR